MFPTYSVLCREGLAAPSRTLLGVLRIGIQQVSPPEKSPEGEAASLLGPPHILSL